MDNQESLNNQITLANTDNKETQVATSKVNRLAMEIRSPLTAINLSVETLQSKTKDVQMQQYFEIINRGTVKITALINEILKSSIQTGNGL